MTNEYEIKEAADKLCRKHPIVHISERQKRNELIIKMLMGKYNINYEYAKYCLENNKDRKKSATL